MSEFFDTDTDTEKETKTGRLVNTEEIAEYLIDKYKIIYTMEDYYIYKNGVYSKCDKEVFFKDIKYILKNKHKPTTTNNVLHFIISETYKKEDNMNKTNLINLQNGMFDIHKETLVSHDPKYLSTIQHNFSYEKDAQCPLWQEFLHEVVEDVEEVQVIQEFFGLCLTKEMYYEKCLILIGGGMNGKGVVLDILAELIGEQNICAVPMDKLSDDRYAGNLKDKLAVISTETKTGAILDDIFKAIVTGDIIEANPKFKNPFSFRPFCKLACAMNNFPHIKDKTRAFFRRFLIIPFNKDFSGRADIHLREKLKSEMSGIFNWAISGYKRLSTRKDFKTSERMQMIIDELILDKNIAALFADQELILNKNAQAELDEIYNAYIVWSQEIEKEQKPLTKHWFSRNLRNYIFQKFPELKGKNFRQGQFKKVNYVLGVEPLLFSDAKKEEEIPF